MQKNTHKDKEPNRAVTKVAKTTEKVTRKVLSNTTKQATRLLAKTGAKIGSKATSQAAGSFVPGVGNAIVAGVDATTEVAGKIIKTGLRQKM